MLVVTPGMKCSNGGVRAECWDIFGRVLPGDPNTEKVAIVDSSAKRQAPRRPSSEYSRVFTAFTAGTGLLVTGIIGLEVGQMRGLFAGTRWADGPIWWQILSGSVLLLLGIYWARRVGRLPGTPDAAPRGRIIKHAGTGKSAGARSLLP